MHICDFHAFLPVGNSQELMVFYFLVLLNEENLSGYQLRIIANLSSQKCFGLSASWDSRFEDGNAYIGPSTGEAKITKRRQSDGNDCRIHPRRVDRPVVPSLMYRCRSWITTLHNWWQDMAATSPSMKFEQLLNRLVQDIVRRKPALIARDSNAWAGSC